MASQKGGPSGVLIGLAVSVFLVVVLVVLLFLQQSKTEQERDKAAQAEKEREDFRRETIGLKKQIRELNKLIHGKEEWVDPALVAKEYLKPGGQKLADVLNKEEWFGEPFAKEITKDGVKLAARDYKYFTEMYSDLFIALEATVNQLNRLRSEKAAAMADGETKAESARRIIAEKEEQISKLGKEKQDLTEAKLKVERDAQAEQKRLAEQNSAVLAEKQKIEEQAAINEARVRSEVSRLEARIAELTEKKKRSLAETEADGEVVHADQRLGLAWVNLGAKDRVRRGTTFEVFQYVKGGARKIKGHIEVKRVDDAMSQVAILDTVDSTDPIVKGDLIASPFFDKQKTIHFAFIGDKLKNDRYSKDELIRRIEEEGGQVDKTVSIATDIAIALEGEEGIESSEEFVRAVQFGVIIMRERELLDFLGR
jgi:HAMP domain-containing protein